MAVFLSVTLGDVRIALSAGAVDRVLHAVEISPLPGAPTHTLGVINIHGTIVPVLDLRARLGLPPRDLHVTDHIVTARTARRTVAVVVDHCDAVFEAGADALTDAHEVLPGIRHVEGVAVDAHGMVFLHDLDAFLSLDEDAQLERAVAEIR